MQSTLKTILVTTKPIKFRCDAGDTVLAEHLSKCAKNATYRSKTTQNDIIDILGGMITDSQSKLG